jgi:hypothetical protein
MRQAAAWDFPVLTAQALALGSNRTEPQLVEPTSHPECRTVDATSYAHVRAEWSGSYHRRRIRLRYGFYFKYCHRSGLAHRRRQYGPRQRRSGLWRNSRGPRALDLGDDDHGFGRDGLPIASWEARRSGPRRPGVRAQRKDTIDGRNRRGFSGFVSQSAGRLKDRRASRAPARGLLTRLSSA